MCRRSFAVANLPDTAICFFYASPSFLVLAKKGPFNFKHLVAVKAGNSVSVVCQQLDDIARMVFLVVSIQAVRAKGV